MFSNGIAPCNTSVYLTGRGFLSKAATPIADHAASLLDDAGKASLKAISKAETKKQAVGDMTNMSLTYAGGPELTRLLGDAEKGSASANEALKKLAATSATDTFQLKDGSDAVRSYVYKLYRPTSNDLVYSPFSKVKAPTTTSQNLNAISNFLKSSIFGKS